MDDIEIFLARRGVSTPGEDDLHAYPDLRDVTTAMVPWPPDGPDRPVLVRLQPRRDALS